MVTTMLKQDIENENIAVRSYGDSTAVRTGTPLSWASVFAGSIFGLMFQVWLSMLGVAIGASTVDPLREANPLNGLGVGSGVWLGISILLSSLVGGWLTGRLARRSDRVDSGVHGAVSWAVSNFVSFVIVGSLLGGIAGGMNRTAQSAMNATGQAAAMANRQGNSGQVQSIADSLSNQAQTIGDEVQNAVRSGQANQQTRETGDTAAKAVAGTSFGIVFLMFVGLLAGIAGSLLGAPRVRRV